MPSSYVKDGTCPHCGAGIYIDGDTRTNDDGSLKELPVQYFTCVCRFNLLPPAPQIIYVPAPPITPQPCTPTWRPQPNTTGDCPNVFDDGHKIICRTPFEIGSGSISQKPDPNIICIN